MLEWAILADDLTGACDTGAVFAQAGQRVFVALRDTHPPGASVLVTSTNSRDLPSEDAARVVHLAASRLPPARLIYKKIDSTLRGHPAKELAAVIASTGEGRALVTPAFPAQERTVRDGQVWVGGAPQDAAVFGSSGSLLATFSNITGARHVPLDLVRGRFDQLVELFRGGSIFLADAETGEDLRILANAGRQAGIRLFSGSAGLAQALAGEYLNTIQVAGPCIDARVLIVVGSRHPAAEAQKAALDAVGIAVLELPFPVLHPKINRLALEAMLQAVIGLPRTLPFAISAPSRSYRVGEEEVVAEALAAVVRIFQLREPVGAMVLTGGDTAASICAALDCRGVWLHGQVQPGIAWGILHGGERDGMPVITKAGGFGAPDALIRAGNFFPVC